MLFDLASYPVWLIAALGIGLVVGWRTYLDAPRRWRDGWIIWGALAFVVGVIVAVLKLLPGRYGLWLEVALLMVGFYFVGCSLGGGLKRLLGAHESGGAADAPAAAVSRNGTQPEIERQATAKAAADRLAIDVAAKAEAARRAAKAEAEAAKAAADRLAAEALAKAEADRKAAAAKDEAANAAAAKAAAAKAEADRLAAEAAAQGEAERARAEIERRAAAHAKAEAERLAATTLAKLEAERLTAEAVAKAVAERKALALQADADRLVAAAAAIGKSNREPTRAETAPATRTLTGTRRQDERRLPPTRRPIILWRKPPQRPRPNEKQIRPRKPRRVIWLQRVTQRSKLGDTPPSRPTRPIRRRTLWLRRLPRPRPC
jgi:hypothetical protein